MPIEDIHGFDVDGSLYFKKSFKYEDLWELTEHYGVPCDYSTIQIDRPTHISILVILYQDNRYYVIARADQYPQFLDITSLFQNIRPLSFKKISEINNE